MRSLILLVLFSNYLHASVQKDAAPSILLTDTDISAAQETHHFFRKSTAKKIDPIALKKSIKEAGRSSLFKEYLPKMNLIYDLITYKDFSLDIQTRCLDKSETALPPTIYRQIDRLCFVHELKGLHSGKISSLKMIIGPDIGEKANWLLKNEQKDLLISFLKKSGISKELASPLAAGVLSFYTKRNLLVPDDLEFAIESKPLIKEAIHLLRSRDIISISSFNKIKKDLLKSIEQRESTIPEESNALYKQIAERLPLTPSEEHYKKVTSVGHELLYSGYPDSALPFFQLSESVAPVDLKDEAIFWQLWYQILYGRYDLALKFINERGLYDQFNTLDSKLKFWIAYTYKLNRYPVLATHLFRTLINEPTVGYYTILSLKELAELNENDATAKLIQSFNKTEVISTISSLTESQQNALKRILAWSKIGNDDFVTTDAYRLITLERKNGQFLSLISKILNEEKRYLHTFKVVYQVFKEQLAVPNRTILEELFPVLYTDLVKEMDQQIDPLLVISLIRQESAFDPKARSPAGAKGLMQLMPATAKQLGGKRKDDLNLPESNLKFGIKYFKQLLDKYNGSLIHALAAYNAGPHRVTRWQDRYLKHENPLFNVESIPYEETRGYVKLIYRNYFFYKLLGNGVDLKRPLSDSFRVSFN